MTKSKILSTNKEACQRALFAVGKSQHFNETYIEFLFASDREGISRTFLLSSFSDPTSVKDGIRRLWVNKWKEKIFNVLNIWAKGMTYSHLSHLVVRSPLFQFLILEAFFPPYFHPRPQSCCVVDVSTCQIYSLQSDINTHTTTCFPRSIKSSSGWVIKILDRDIRSKSFANKPKQVGMLN